MIIGFSFFAATILNSDFRGRTFVRTLFSCLSFLVLGWS